MLSCFKMFALRVGCISALLSSLAHSVATPNVMQIKTSIENLTSIACDVSAKRCLAVGFDLNIKELDEERAIVSMENKVYRTQDGADTWSQPQVLSHGIHDLMLSGIEELAEFQSVQMQSHMTIYCNASGLSCLIAGPKKIDHQSYIIIHATDDGGLNWHDAQLLPVVLEHERVGRVDGLACDESGHSCLLLNYPYAYTSENGGQTWMSPVLLPEPEIGYAPYDVVQMSCSASGLVCRVVVGEGSDPAPILTYVTQDGGLTWSNPYVLTDPEDKKNEKIDTDFFSNLHCDRSGLNCMALRYRLVKEGLILRTLMDVYTTSNTGLVWEKTGTIDHMDGNLYEPFGVFDCDETGQTCVAIHSPAYTEDSEARAYITYDRGQHWKGQLLNISPKSSFITDIFCDNLGLLCQAVGIRGA